MHAMTGGKKKKEHMQQWHANTREICKTTEKRLRLGSCWETGTNLWLDSSTHHWGVSCSTWLQSVQLHELCLGHPRHTQAGNLWISSWYWQIVRKKKKHCGRLHYICLLLPLMFRLTLTDPAWEHGGVRPYVLDDWVNKLARAFLYLCIDL